METILDFNPTPAEMYEAGFTDSETDPITDAVRAAVLSRSDESKLLCISDMLYIRGDDAQGLAYLQRVPADDDGRRMREEIMNEWSILKDA